MLTANELRQKYIDFFVARGHKQIPSAPLVPENDPSTLFTGSGMQPMIPYLLGQPHPLGVRLVDSQKCFRAQDIEKVGDNRHDSFFEMLGNWSLGEYFKKEQIEWIFQFVIDKKVGLGLSPSKIFVSVFRGNPKLRLPRDQEAADIWSEKFSSLGLDHKIADFPEKNGLQNSRIFYYNETKNWWSRSGVPNSMPIGEPGGPDSEMFYDFGASLGLHEDSVYKDLPCHPNCDCGRFLEIGNSVFMTYKKTDMGFVPLVKKNIDFGGGLERLLAAVNNNPDIFTTNLYTPVMEVLSRFTGEIYSGSAANRQSFQIIADHLKAATFLIADGVFPSNKTQGYFLRRLLRRAMIKVQKLEKGTNAEKGNLIYNQISDAVINLYQDAYPQLGEKHDYIQKTISDERDRFSQTLSKGLREFNKLNKIDGKIAFDLFQTFGFPLEVTIELAIEKGQTVDQKQFQAEFTKHQELSRTASKGMFKGGLEDHSETVTKYHTATHLLHKALRDVLGTHVQQKGSNITSERLRFDFSHPAKLTSQELQLIESSVNQKIAEDLPVTRQEMPKTKALAEGAMAFFPEKYPEVTSVYTIGHPDHWYSKELCGGPHVASTGIIGKIKIIKEESAGAGVRRIYAQLA